MAPDARAPPAVLAYDIGGTTCRAGLIAGSGVVRKLARRDSRNIREAEDRLGALERTLIDLAAEVGALAPAAVVLAVPGPVLDGRADRLPTLFGAEAELRVDFSALGRRLWPHAALAVCNDMTAAGYRYVGEGETDFLVVTLGSGVGAKLFIGGRPLLGAAGGGGEIGHWRVPGAESCICECGGRGHLGAVASGRGALQVARSLAREAPDRFRRSLAGELSGGREEALTSRALAQALRADDAWTMAALVPAAEALGAALALCHLATGVDRFFVTGGFASACGEPLRRMICRAAQAHGWSTGVDWSAAIVFTGEGAEDGLLGAGVYGRRMLEGLASCA